PLARLLPEEIHEPREDPEPRPRADQDDAVEPLRPVERERLHDGPAHRVAGEDDGPQVQRGEKSLEPLRVARDARLAWAAERAVTGKVERDDARHPGEPLELGLPEIRGPARAVNEDERKSGSGFDPRRRAPRDSAGAARRLGHRTAPRAVIGQRAS